MIAIEFFPIAIRVGRERIGNAANVAGAVAREENAAVILASSTARTNYEKVSGEDKEALGQGNAAHTHEVEECFFVLQGYMTVFVEDESGKRLETRLGPWDTFCCPAGVIHGYQNDSLEPVYFQVMLGRGKPEAMGYADEELYKRREAHLKAV